MITNSKSDRIRKVNRTLIVSLVILFTSSIPVSALKDGLALTPPMGWNSWNTFFGGISESLILASAKAMATSGMKDAGYRYVVIDDGWISSRDASTKKPVENKTLFPHGFKYLTDSIHALGLKAGIYTSTGNQTCMGLVGSLGYEAIDAQQYADWGFDFLKNDWCKMGSSYGTEPWTLYSRMKNGIKKAGRPIVLSICEKGQSSIKTPWSWSDSVGHMWRTTNDINASFSTVIGRCVGGTAGLDKYAGAGGFNDPDMLEVGNTKNGMGDTEFRSHFSLWCVMASPLMAGNDLRSMTPAVTTILCNKDAIAVDQDALAAQGVQIASGNSQIFVKKMKRTETRAVLLFNYNSSATTMSIKWTDKNVDWKATDKVTVFDIWTKTKTTGVTNGYTASNIPSHGCSFVLLTNESMPVSVNKTATKESPNVFSLNQTKENISLSLPNSHNTYSVQIVDMKGRACLSGIAQGTIYSIKNKTIANGMLIATVSTNGKTVFSKRFINTK